MTEEVQEKEAEVVEKRQPTEYEKTLVAYNHILLHYRGAIRWLREIHGYKRMFEASESWGEDREMNNWLMADAQRAFREVYIDIRRMREKLDELSERLMDLKSKEKSDGE